MTVYRCLRFPPTPALRSAEIAAISGALSLRRPSRTLDFMTDRPIADADQNPKTVPAPIDPMAYYFQDVLLLSQKNAVRRYLIRHGQSASNQARVEGRLGEFHPPLTPIGEAQAERVGERMASYGVDAIYASPLQRAYNTAKPIADR